MLFRAVAVLFLCFFSIPTFAQESQSRSSRPVKAVYFGSNAYGVQERTDNIVNLLRNYEVNAVVVDYKDDHGNLIRGEKFRIVVKPFRDAGAMIICRITAFKDNINALARPELALKTRSSKATAIWKNNRREAFLDPANKDVLRFIISISLDAKADGCEELNYDYIRFPSDGSLSDIALPVSNKPNEKYPYMRRAMRNFLKELSHGVQNSYPKVPYSADLFGVAAMWGEPGIGQYVEDFAEFGFGVYGMFYPSHYECNSFGILDPNTDPFIVHYRSLSEQLRRLKKHGYTEVSVRSWLQGFSIVNIYGCGSGPDKKNPKRIIGIVGKQGKKVEYADDPARFRQQIRAILDVRTEKEFQEFRLDDSWIVWHSGAYYNPQNFLKKK